MISKLTSIADEKIEDVIKMARESAKIYGGEWDSALIAESPGNNVHGITSDHIEAVVVRTDDDSLHSSWLCDYLESVSPAFVIAALRELQERRKAAKDSEPVAWLLSGGGAKNVVCFDSGNAYSDPLREVTPLYRQAQQSVVPEGLHLALSNAGIAAPESDEMLAAIRTACYDCESGEWRASDGVITGIIKWMDLPSAQQEPKP